MKTISDLRYLINENSDFVKIISSGFISHFGSYFTMIAIVSLSYSITGQKSSLGISAFFYIVPNLFGGFFSGVLSDTYNRRNIMIYTDLLRAVVVLGFIFAIYFSNVYIIYSITFLNSLIGIFFLNAKKSIIPEIVGKEKVIKYNSINTGVDSFTFVIGSGIGGFALSLIGYKAIFVFDSLTFVISALILLNVLYAPTSVVEKKEPYITKFIKGLHYLKENKQIVNIVTFYPFHGFALGIFNIVNMIFIFDIFKKGPNALGVLYSLVGISSLISTYIVGRFLSKIIKTKYHILLLISILIEIIIVIQFLTINNFYLYMFLVPFLHIFDYLVDVSESSFIMYRTENNYLGRVNSINTMGYMSFYAFGMLYCGLTSDYLSVNTLIILTIAVFCASLLYLLSAFTISISRRKENFAESSL